MEKLLLTVEEVANTLGYSKYYTYQLIRNGEIASMKGNGKKSIVRVPTTALQEYIDAHMRPSNRTLSESASNALNRG